MLEKLSKHRNMIVWAFCAILFIVAVVAGAKGEKKNEYNSLVTSNKINYQKGIDDIKNQKWDDATTALIFLRDKNYKDSKALYSYASAKKELQSNEDDSIEMADYYMKDISGTYSGPFKDDIMAFKQECKQKKIEADQSEQETEQEEAEQYKAQKIVDTDGKHIWKIYITGGSFSMSGNYTGSGNFIIKLLDSNEDLVDVPVNEIGDYVLYKTVDVPYDGWYYLQIESTDGSYHLQWSH